eukprot:1195624-Prorocentrum_minimum.AAC.3
MPDKLKVARCTVVCSCNLLHVMLYWRDNGVLPLGVHPPVRRVKVHRTFTRQMRAEMLQPAALATSPPSSARNHPETTVSCCMTTRSRAAHRRAENFLSLDGRLSDDHHLQKGEPEPEVSKHARRRAGLSTVLAFNTTRLFRDDYGQMRAEMLQAPPVVHRTFTRPAGMHT